MSVTKTQLTADELFNMSDDGNHYELIKGELSQMTPAGGEHGVITVNLTIELGAYIKNNDLGVICAAETGFKISVDPDTVRAPDIAFVSKARIPATGIPKSFWPFAPDLAVEVLSPGDNYHYVEEKITDWLSAGVRVVVIVNPRKRNVKLYRSQTDFTLLTESDQLTFEDVVAGFSYPIAKMFV